jgi:ribosomal protein S12 methylthiotransferase
MKKKSFYLVSLGCAKNTVDSDSIATLLSREGYTIVENPAQAEVMIVNTCGFIQPARQESIDVLSDLAGQKKPGQLLIAAGCFTELYGERLALEVKGIDGIIGTRRWMDLPDLVGTLRRDPGKPRYHLPETPTIGRDDRGVPRVSLRGSSAYLKIADGCRRPCAYCSIPLIKGTQVSRPMEDILRDAAILQDNGVQELILISQDTTDYGSDLGIKDGLAGLLENLLPRVPSIPWVRILYAYPGYVTDNLIDLMSERQQVVPYLDIPLQHASPGILKAMKRPANMDWARSTIEKMRQRIPGLALRTTFIVGYPGESNADFQLLVDFIREIEFDHLGVFPFSYESGTSSAPLGDPIPETVKLERVDQLMTLQETISLKKNQQFIGKTLDVLVEGYGDEISVGRSYRDAPEIDGLVIVEDKLPVGVISRVQVTGALKHDLIARAIPQ